MLEMSHFGRSHLLPCVVFASVLVPPLLWLVVMALFPDYSSSLEMSKAFFIVLNTTFASDNLVQCVLILNNLDTHF